jgi:hypothetical protein
MHTKRRTCVSVNYVEFTSPGRTCNLLNFSLEGIIDVQYFSLRLKYGIDLQELSSSPRLQNRFLEVNICSSLNLFHISRFSVALTRSGDRGICTFYCNRRSVLLVHDDVLSRFICASKITSHGSLFQEMCVYLRMLYSIVFACAPVTNVVKRATMPHQYAGQKNIV